MPHCDNERISAASWLLSSGAYLDVGDGGVQRAGPVHQPLAPVDHPLLVHTDEGLLDRVGQFLDKNGARFFFLGFFF